MKNAYLLFCCAFIFNMTSLSAQLSLDVQGAGKIGGNLEVDNGNLSVDIGKFLNFTREDNSAGGFLQGLTQGVLLGHNRGGNNAILGVDGGNIVFSTGGNDLAERMRINKVGNVGIGVTIPKEKLHVDGDYYGRGHLYLYALEGDGNDGVAYIQGRDDSGTSSIALQFRTQNAGSSFDAMHISNSGNVGIGTSDPQSKLHVNGSVRLEQLPIGAGSPLVIDANGNVFRSSTNVQADSERLDKLEKENADLRSRLEQLESYLSSMMEEHKKMETSNSLVLTAPQLQQNQPNPFNGQTTIQYFLPEATQTAQIQINDQNGRILKVETLQGNGYGQITLDTKALPSGTYSYSLLVDGRLVETKQMILAK